MNYVINPNENFDPIVKIDDRNEKDNIYKLINSKIVFDGINYNKPHYNHIETSGFYSSSIIFYGMNELKDLFLKYHLIFPHYRRKNNNTLGSFRAFVDNEVNLLVDEEKINEKLSRIEIDYTINIFSKTDKLDIKREFVNSYNDSSFVIKYEIKNTTNNMVNIDISNDIKEIFINEDIFDKPYYLLFNIYDNGIKDRINKALNQNESYIFYSIISVSYNKEKLVINPIDDFNKRLKFRDDIKNNLDIKLNNDVVDKEIEMTKYRTFESVYNLACGYIHSPGGGNYYASVWTNDQIEYSAPLAALIDYKYMRYAIENTLSMYEEYMYKDEPLVSSIIAENTSYWNGAKDRGDGAMYLYGASLYLLILGDKEKALKYSKAIKWCIDYSISKINKYGILESDSDELENRFESGNANLSVNSLFYKGLIYASRLFNELGIDNDYLYVASKLKENIIKNFHHDNKWYYALRCDDNEIKILEKNNLRSHISYLLIMDILDFKDDVYNELLSNKLLNENGFKTIETSDVYWDRITLMSLRGLFRSGKVNEAYDILKSYSNNRLLNKHVPYPVEAYPEGNQAHLAAESSLYVRIFLEGLLGFEPISFNKFSLTFNIPDDVSNIKINNFFYSSMNHSIKIEKINNELYYSFDNSIKKHIRNKEVIIQDV